MRRCPKPHPLRESSTASAWCDLRRAGASAADARLGAQRERLRGRRGVAAKGLGAWLDSAAAAGADEADAKALRALHATLLEELGWPELADEARLHALRAFPPKQLR